MGNERQLARRKKRFNIRWTSIGFPLWAFFTFLYYSLSFYENQTRRKKVQIELHFSIYRLVEKFWKQKWKNVYFLMKLFFLFNIISLNLNTLIPTINNFIPSLVQPFVYFCLIKTDFIYIRKDRRGKHFEIIKTCFGQWKTASKAEKKV